MVTIGLSMVFQAALKWIFGVNPQPFPRVFQNASVDLFGLQIQTVYVMSLIVSVLMMIGMAWFFRSSKYGLAMRATAFNQQVAQSLGISVKNVFAMAWAISATVSAVAGVVVAVVNGVSSGLSAYGTKGFPAAILGGLDSIGGAVLGAFCSAYLSNNFPIPVFFAIPLAGIVTALVGLIFGVPAARLKGLYLVIATLAAQYILLDFFSRAEWFSGGSVPASANPFSIL